MPKAATAPRCRQTRRGILTVTPTPRTTSGLSPIDFSSLTIAIASASAVGRMFAICPSQTFNCVAGRQQERYINLLPTSPSMSASSLALSIVFHALYFPLPRLSICLIKPQSSSPIFLSSPRRQPYSGRGTLLIED